MTTWKDLKNNPRLKKAYDTRIEIIKLIREFFWAKGFVETDTPIAVKCPGQEPYLNPVAVEFFDPNNRKEKFYLHTSPEFAMKKLLAAGYEKIFQICKCFRNGEEFGGQHNAEFTMIEWYRYPGTYQEIMDDAENLFKFVSQALHVSEIKYNDKMIKMIGKWDKVSMTELWKKYIEVNLDEYLKIEELKDLVSERGYQVSEDDTYDDLFYKIFLNEIESKLGLEKPIFVYDYPAQMASLSRLCPRDAGYAERFELYIGGLELANAFGELLDADEQLRRLEEDKKLREKLGKETWPVDMEFIEALKALGRFKTASGIALGVDRMVELFTGSRGLDEVMFMSVADQIG